MIGGAEMKVLLRNLDKILTDLDSIKPENSAYSLLVGLKGFLKKEINNVLGEIKSPSELTPQEKLELIKEMGIDSVAERERIIEEIEKHDKSNCTVCPFLKNETECMYNFFHCTCIWWQSLKAKIREGKYRYE